MAPFAPVVGSTSGFVVTFVVRPSSRGGSSVGLLSHPQETSQSHAEPGGATPLEEEEEGLSVPVALDVGPKYTIPLVAEAASVPRHGRSRH